MDADDFYSGLNNSVKLPLGLLDIYTFSSTKTKNEGLCSLVAPTKSRERSLQITERLYVLNYSLFQVLILKSRISVEKLDFTFYIVKCQKHNCGKFSLGQKPQVHSLL